jgi:hypothetical protein
MYFLYSVPPTRPAGSLEAFLFPILVTNVPQKLLTTVMADKSGLLIEHMRLMGLNWSSYWISNFLFEGLLLGIPSSLLLSLFSSYGLFNGAAFPLLFFMFLSSLLSNISFALCFGAIFDNSRTCSIVNSAITIVIYFSYFIINQTKGKSAAAQIICCLVPPLGAQIAGGSYREDYDGIGVEAIVVLLVGQNKSLL